MPPLPPQSRRKKSRALPVAATASHPERRWWSCHTHSHFSKIDGMRDIQSMVDFAVQLDYPALGITDHGNMGGAVQLYKACNAAGIKPFIGMEGYLIEPLNEDPLDAKTTGKLNRYHFGLLALNHEGYKGLIQLNNLSHTKPRFNRFPRVTLTDLLEFAGKYGKHVAFTTGCYFGWIQQQIDMGDFEQANISVKMLARVFPHMFVEVQHHNIQHAQTTDDDMVSVLDDIATQNGLPLLATQDSHYVHQYEKPAHELMKRMVYAGSDDAFPGDSFHMASAEWVEEHYSPQTWQRALDGSAHLYSLGDLRLPALDNYKPHIPALFDNPSKVLRAEVVTGLKKTGRMAQKYLDRADYELNVIDMLGMAAYFLLIKRCTDHFRTQHWAFDVRGSANSSLVLNAIGVHDVDPLQWKLTEVSFDRFLAEDRVSPPDVDIDIEDAHRGEALAWLARNFQTLQIGTWGALGVRKGDDQGSIVVTYKSWLMSTAEKKAIERYKDPVTGKLDAEARAKVKQAKSKWGWIQTVDDVARAVDEDDAAMLREIDAMSGKGGKHLGVYRSAGTHASGILVTDSDMPLDDYVPRMRVSENAGTVVSQFDQDDVEALGLVKIDLLGQTSLAIMRRCQELMGRDDPTDFNWIPWNDPDACKLMREGRTETGIFHVEAYTKSKGGRELGIKSTMDSVMLMALYMPGAMEERNGQPSQKNLFLLRRKDKQARANVRYLHPAFEAALKDTYGTVIFQDQVMSIMRTLGMSKLSVNKFLKVVKDSGKGSSERNAKRMAEVREEFDGLCEQHGLDPDEVWEQTAGFANYGFNRAHATGYGIRAYRMAYLKAHYLDEFIGALLEVYTGKEKEPAYVREARRCGMRLAPPDVNVSGPAWTLDKKRTRAVIRKGLASIKGVGYPCAIELQSKAPFKSLEDLVARCNGRAVTGGKEFIISGDLNELRGNLKALYEAQALDSVID